MSKQMILVLPDDTYEQAEQLAEIRGGNIAEAVTATLREFLPLLTLKTDNRPVRALSDTELLQTADSMLDARLDEWLTTLLEKQQSTPLNEAEEADLKMLMAVYNTGQLRKAEAWAEIIERGLREAPDV